MFDSFVAHHAVLRASLVAQSVKNLPAVQETQVRSLGWEDPLEKEMPTHSSILAWKILWTEEPGGLQSMGSQKDRHDWATNTYLLTYAPPSMGFPRQEYLGGLPFPSPGGLPESEIEPTSPTLADWFFTTEPLG